MSKLFIVNSRRRITAMKRKKIPEECHLESRECAG